MKECEIALTPTSLCDQLRIQNIANQSTNPSLNIVEDLPLHYIYNLKEFYMYSHERN